MRKHSNPERVELHKLLRADKTRKQIARGHEDLVRPGMDEAEEVCWAWLARKSSLQP